MVAGRVGPAVALLAGGRVLVAGGSGPLTGLSTSEVFDPKSGSFEATGGLPGEEPDATATQLPGGQVLIAGGSPTYRAAIWDPVSGVSKIAPTEREQRLGHTATLLADGRVLVVGGRSGAPQVFNEAYLYEP